MVTGPIPHRQLLVIERLLSIVEAEFPMRSHKDDDVPGEVGLALAAIARMTQLLRAEMLLCQQGLWAVSRVPGRALHELWVYACLLLLEGGPAVQQLEGEEQHHRQRLEVGARALWEEVDRARGGPDRRTGFVPDGPVRSPDLRNLTKRVAELRRARGLDPAIPLTLHEWRYRWDSTYHVHPSMAMLFQYVTLDGEWVTVRSEPAADQSSELTDAIEQLHHDSQRLADAYGHYLDRCNRRTEIQQLQDELWRLWSDASGAAD